MKLKKKKFKIKIKKKKTIGVIESRPYIREYFIH